CETYWVTLLATACTGESFELAQVFGDDIAFRSGIYHVGPSQLAQMMYVLGRTGGDGPTRLRLAAGIVASRGKAVEKTFLAHCAITREVSARVGLDPAVGAALLHTFARWDGKGVPRGVGSEEVAMPARLMLLAE